VLTSALPSAFFIAALAVFCLHRPIAAAPLADSIQASIALVIAFSAARVFTICIVAGLTAEASSPIEAAYAALATVSHAAILVESVPAAVMHESILSATVMALKWR
jgi:hypothetical protein